MEAKKCHWSWLIYMDTPQRHPALIIWSRCAHDPSVCAPTPSDALWFKTEGGRPHGLSRASPPTPVYYARLRSTNASPLEVAQLCARWPTSRPATMWTQRGARLDRIQVLWPTDRRPTTCSDRLTSCCRCPPILTRAWRLRGKRGSRFLPRQ